MKNKNNLTNFLKNLYDYQCVKIAGVVGTGIHLYSQAINNSHFQGIYEDFANGNYVRGALKTAVPFLLPYFVSLYARKKTKKENKEKINDLEERLDKLKFYEEREEWKVGEEERTKECKKINALYESLNLNKKERKHYFAISELEDREKYLLQLNKQ